MSVMIERKAKFLDVPLVKVRNVLRAWRYGGTEDAGDIARRKDVELDPRTVMILLDELRDRELIGEEVQPDRSPIDGLTEAGFALIAASGRRRVPKAQARPVLDSYLRACDAFNARTDLPVRVEQIWLFGSMVDDRMEDVGDIDFVPIFQEVGAFAEGRRDTLRRFMELAKQMGGSDIVNRSGVMSWFKAESFVIGRLLYGGKRHPLLAPNDIGTLKKLGRPCQLIFDHGRGGRVDDPVLPRHPDSSGRANDIHPPREMPDLSRGRQSLRPLPVEILDPRRITPRVVVERSIWPWEEGDPHREFYLRFRRSGMGMHVVTDKCKLPDGLKQNVVLKKLRLINLDGRFRFGLLVTDVPPDQHWKILQELPFAERLKTIRDRPQRHAIFGLTIERSISERSNCVEYRLCIEKAIVRGGRLDYSAMTVANWWLWLISTADIEHIARRESEAGTYRPITINIFDADSRGLTDDDLQDNDMMIDPTEMLAANIKLFSAKFYETTFQAGASQRERHG